jgi:hypothetical protein
MHRILYKRNLTSELTTRLESIAVILRHWAQRVSTDNGKTLHTSWRNAWDVGKPKDLGIDKHIDGHED